MKQLQRQLPKAKQAPPEEPPEELMKLIDSHCPTTEDLLNHLDQVLDEIEEYCE